MEQRSSRNVALYVGIMIGGSIICGLFSGWLVGLAFSSYTVNWGFLFLGWLISLIPMVYHVCIMSFAVRDYNDLCGSRNEDYYLTSMHYALVYLLSMVTLGIYRYYWIYKYGQNLKELGNRREKYIRDKGSTYLTMILVPLIVTWFFAFLFIILCISAGVSANRWNASGAIGSITGAAVCFVIAIIAGCVRNIMEIVAHAKWMSNLNTLTDYGPGQYGYGPAPKPVLPEGKIRILTGQYCNAELDVPENAEIILGREKAYCHLIFENEHVSRKHCGVRYVRGTNSYMVTDYSLNGTYIKGGGKLPKDCPTALQRGTVLELGQSGEAFLLM
jgi:hypothetical protein